MNTNNMTTAQLFDVNAQGVAGLSQQLISKAEARPDAVYVAVAGVIGALTTLALVVGENPEERVNADFNPACRVNADTMLFGALLAVETSTPNGHRKIDANTSAAGHEIEFSPATVMAALAQFEKLTGRKPDAKLCPEMVQAARMGMDAAVVMLADVLKRKPQAQAPGPDSIN